MSGRPAPDHAECDSPDGDADDEVEIAAEPFPRTPVSQTAAKIASSSITPYMWIEKFAAEQVPDVEHVLCARGSTRASAHSAA